MAETHTLEKLGHIESDIVELQTRLQFQDDLIHKLDEIIIQQSRQLEQYRHRLDLLEDRLEQLQFERRQAATTDDEKPPHY